MYLVLTISSEFCGILIVFSLWISQDFTDLHEIRGSTTAQNIRSSEKGTDPNWKSNMLVVLVDYVFYVTLFL